MGRVLFDAGTINPHSIATSELSPQDPEVSAYIRLRREFFDLPPNRQVLTLLHETIHLALFAGPCADWNTENCEINGRYTENPLEASQTRQLVDGAALRTAIQLFHFKDEIAAEKYLQRHHAAQGHERAAYYLDMQLSNREKRANRNLPPELLPFWLLLDVLRAGLGCAISNKELATKARGLHDAACEDLRLSTRSGLLDAVPALLNLDVSPLQADMKAYRDNFQAALNAKAPDLSGV